MNTSPKIIRKKDPARIEIDWADGSQTVFRAVELRRLCPCANCVNEVTGERMLDPHSVPDAIEQRDVRLVGHYAISVRFSDGHDTGIFPFDFLRANDPRG